MGTADCPRIYLYKF